MQHLIVLIHLPKRQMMRLEKTKVKIYDRGDQVEGRDNLDQL